MTNKTLIVLVAIFCSLLLLVAAVLRVLTPQELPPPPTPTVGTTNFTGSTTTFTDITYAGPSIDVPNQLPVVAVTTTPLDIATLLSTFDLSPHVVVPNLWIGQAYSLTLQEDGTYLFSQEHSSAGATTNSTSGVNLTDSLSIAQGFWQQWYPTSLIERLDQAQYFNYDEAEPEAKLSPDEATLVAIPFALAHHNLPIYLDYQNQAPFTVTVAENQRLVRATFLSSTLVFGQEANYAPISIETAITNINLNNGTVLSAYTGGRGLPLSLENITSGRMTEVSLEYRLDATVNQLFPMYRFRGVARNTNDDEMDIELITPAIETTGR